MSDAQLEAKFLDLTVGPLPEAQARRALAACRNVEKLANGAEIAAAVARA
jgi:hypothetical protein